MKKLEKKATAAKQKRHPEPDVNQLAHDLVGMSTEEKSAVLPGPTDADIRWVMAELGRRGGKIGGKNRAEALSPEKRRMIASKAAQTRWAKRRNSPSTIQPPAS